MSFVVPPRSKCEIPLHSIDGVVDTWNLNGPGIYRKKGLTHLYEPSIEFKLKNSVNTFKFYGSLFIIYPDTNIRIYVRWPIDDNQKKDNCCVYGMQIFNKDKTRVLTQIKKGDYAVDDTPKKYYFK